MLIRDLELLVDSEDDPVSQRGWIVRTGQTQRPQQRDDPDERNLAEALKDLGQVMPVWGK